MQENSSLMERNLERLNTSPECWRRLLGCDPEGCFLEGSTPENTQIHYQGQPLYSGAHPLSQASAEADGLVEGKSPGLLVFFGLGLGWHLRFLRAKSPAPILVYEPLPDVAATVLQSRELELENVHLTTDLVEFEDLLASFAAQGGDDLIAGALPAWTRLAQDEFGHFKAILQKSLEKKQIDFQTRVSFSADWVANTVHNLPVLGKLKPLESLRAAMSGQPSVIVGAGPSLDRNIADLREMGDRVFVVAVHSSVAPLAEAGVVPDAVVIVEGQKLDHYFEGADLEKMVLLPSPQTHPVHLGLSFGDILGLSLEGTAAADWFAAAYGEEPLPSGGSVTCTAFSLLHQLGCDPLSLMGADFAYTDDRGHARNNETGCCTFTHDRDEAKIRTRCTEGIHQEFEYQAQLAPGWGTGEAVLTRPELSSFRHWFETAARTWGSGRVLINATEGGSRVRGFEELPLRTALEKHGVAGLEAKRRIAEALGKASARTPEPLHREVARELEHIRKSGVAAQRVLDGISEPRKRLRQKKLHNIQPLLDKLALREKDLQTATRTTRLLNTLVGHRARMLTPSKETRDPVARTLNSLELSQAIAQLVVTGAVELEALLAPAVIALQEEGK